MAAADATTAMTIDFLRARLLSERSVSRAAKERADQLTKRVRACAAPVAALANSPSRPHFLSGSRRCRCCCCRWRSWRSSYGR
jgi:hypothetical protein